MLALEKSDQTRALTALGERIVREHGKPKAALMISAHWFEPTWKVQVEEHPAQIYDMYGFPDELYEFKYNVSGDPRLGRRVVELSGGSVVPDEGHSWGIDHGAWTTLAHLFPAADVALAQLSVKRSLDMREAYELGQRLAPLRDEGYLILGSGNIVHNLYRVKWDMPHEGFAWAQEFDQQIRDLVCARDDERLLAAQDLPNYKQAAPTPEHFLPLIYLLGASQGEEPVVFNSVLDLGSVSMTSFAFGV
jgi:4,5-DOPA dioxygenase extradiol